MLVPHLVSAAYYRLVFMGVAAGLEKQNFTN